jgi:hypothetical protein
MTFFERQTELPQPFPEATNADLHIVFRQEPGLQLGKRRIGFAHDACAESFVMGGKLWFGAACPRTRARLSCPPAAPENFVDIGHANLEDGRRGIGARSRIHRRHHPLAQVLRVSSPPLPSPAESTAKRESKFSPHWNPWRDSINNEDALGRNGEADLVAFSVPFLANPDLPKRYRLKAPLNVPDQATFYAGEDKGFTDYPALA